MKPSLITHAVKACFRAKKRPMLWGPPGVGKTDLLSHIAREMECSLIIVHGLTQDAVDVHGFPCVREVEGEGLITLFSRPGFFPRKERVVILLDEFCFVENTMVSVLGEDGNVIEKPIQDIRIGERVVSQDLHNVRSRANLVERVMSRRVTGLFELKAADGTTIRATGNHPFYTQRGWVPLAQLQQGDRLYRVPDVRQIDGFDLKYASSLARHDDHGISREISGIEDAASSDADRGFQEYVEEAQGVGGGRSELHRQESAGSQGELVEVITRDAASQAAAGARGDCKEVHAGAAIRNGEGGQRFGQEEAPGSFTERRTGSSGLLAERKGTGHGIHEVQEVLGSQSQPQGRVERQESRNGHQRPDSVAIAEHPADLGGAVDDVLYREASFAAPVRGGQRLTCRDHGRSAALAEPGLRDSGAENGGAARLVLDQASSERGRGLHQGGVESSSGERSGNARRELAFDEAVGLYFDEVTSVTLIAFDGEVYDLTVANDHNFFANGVLVHNCAAPGMIQTAFSQMLLHGRIGEHILPENTHICLASNRMSDRAIVHTLPTPLANRMVHIDFEVDLDDWTQWAFAADVKEEVIAFNRFAPGALHEFDPHDKKAAKSAQERTGEHAFCTPRSWHAVSDLMKAEPDPRVERDLIIGTVGKARGTEFISYLDIYRKAPDLDSILLDPKKAKVPEQLSIKYAVAIGLSRKMDAKNCGAAMIYLERLPSDMNAMATKAAVDRDPSIGKTKDFINWSMRHHDDLFVSDIK